MAVSKLKKVIVKFIQFFQENLRCGRDKVCHIVEFFS